VNVVLVVAEMTLASARDTIRILSWLKTNAAHVQPIVVANKVQSGLAEISKSDFEASIERKIAFTVPYDVKAATNAAKLGQTFADANRTTKAGAAIRDVAKTIMGVGQGEVVDEIAKPKSSLLGKIDLKGMLSKKTKPADKARETA
jgi:pilus assembly protein CpaE